MISLCQTRWAILIVLPVAPSLGCRPPRAPADLVVRDAAVVTMDRDVPSAQAVAIRDGRIIYVGSDEGVTSLMGPGTEIVDGKGGTVLPGLVDSHVHPVSGVELLGCDLTNDSTPEQVLSTVRECAAAHPTDQWVRGTGWQLPVFPQANPQATDLDRVVGDRPAYLTAADGHSAWVNTRALRMAGIDRSTPDPENGRIERDISGAPSGTLRESAATMVGRLLPPYTMEEYITAFRQALAMANRAGITAIIEANADSAMLAAYHVMDSSGQLTARVTAAQSLDLSQGAAQIPRLVRLRDRFRGPLLDPSSAKIFADGVIEAGTAALLAPYLNRPGNRGHPNLDSAGFDSLVVALDQARFQVHVHAIGDRAIRMALDAFERAGIANGPRDRRPIIAHLELIDPADIPRFRALGVIADFQPLWAYNDSYITDLTEPVLGPARSRWLYPIASVLKTGATVVGGSDWSVSSMNPFEAMQVAITRRAPDAAPGPGWIPEEEVDLPSMIAAYTINGAYARFADGETGSLRAGKLGDLVLLNRNLLTTPAQDIGKTEVLLTVLGGKIVYRAGQN